MTSLLLWYLLKNLSLCINYPFFNNYKKKTKPILSKTELNENLIFLKKKFLYLLYLLLFISTPLQIPTNYYLLPETIIKVIKDY